MDRAMAAHPMFKADMARLGAWSWLVLHAVWRPTRHDVAGRMIMLERGQLCVSVRLLAEQWGWTKTSTERFLTRLRDEEMIRTDAGTGRMIITICNYSKYQDDSAATGTPETPENGTKKGGTQTGTPTGTPTGTVEDEKNNANSTCCDDISEEAGTLTGTQSGTRAGHKRTIEKIYTDNIGVLRPRARRDPAPRPVHIPPDWSPGPYPQSVTDLVAQWPPGREQSELMEFREYWSASNERRANWDRTWHNRIRHQHDRIISNRNSAGAARTNERGDTFLAACAAGLYRAPDAQGEGP